VDEILAKVTTTSTTFPLPDALGSTIAVADGSGAVLERVYYSDAFGTPTFKDASGTTLAGTSTGTRFLFTGREWLAELNFYDYRNRTYSAELGRFIETDPIRFNAGDLNLYRYVGNNPVNAFDPFGFWELRTRPLGGLAKIGADLFYGPGDRRGEHYQFFYEDGSDSGYLGDKNGQMQFGSDCPNKNKYKDPIAKGSDDDLLKQAEKNVQYRWKNEGRTYNHPENDCQTYACSVLSEFLNLRTSSK
jgi:RHS repeat-associated protein